MARDRPKMASVDLHGLHPDLAFRKLSQALHSARVQGSREIQVITGQGLGNRAQEPVLRKRVENWLRGPEGKRFAVRSFQLESRGGALRVQLGDASSGR